MTRRLYGQGDGHRRLARGEIAEVCGQALVEVPSNARRVLVLIPDHTRHAPIGLFFRAIAEALLPRVDVLDVLVATGTHAPMPLERLHRHIGITASELRDKYAKVRLFNHDHRDPESLVSLGSLDAGEVLRLTQGLFDAPIPITINKKALEYDHILIVSPVVPHEAMGFAGGNKYLFPGIAGLDVVEAFHWLAAVITNPVINGVKDTPTRRVIDRVVEFLPTPRTCFAFAVDQQHELVCLFAGSPEAAWASAADVSAKLHIKYLDRPYKRVLGLTPPIYEDLWVAGKAMYKLEPIVADGGELVIQGPHVREVSFVHGAAITRIGYHVRDYFVKQWDRFASEPRLILAHSTNVRGVGSFDIGVESPRIGVTLATGIPRETCQRINLGYRQLSAGDIERWRHDADTLVIDEAGQDLYRLGTPAALPAER